MNSKYDKLNKIAQEHGFETIYVTYCIDCRKELYLPVAGEVPHSTLEKLLCCRKCEECREASKRMRERELREREEASKYIYSYNYSLWEMSIGELLKKLKTRY